MTPSRDPTEVPVCRGQLAAIGPERLRSHPRRSLKNLAARGELVSTQPPAEEKHQPMAAKYGAKVKKRVFNPQCCTTANLVPRGR